MDIIFVRHGKTILNEKNAYVGSIDTDISENGVEEIKKLRRLFQGVEFNKVFSSPLKRAIQSTQIITKNNYTVDNRLKEMNFGIFEGLSYNEICEKYPVESKKWVADYFNYNIPGGESLKQVFNRTENFLKDISHLKGRVLVVTHGGIISCVLSLVFNKKDYFFKFKILHGRMNIVSIEDKYMYIKAINCLDEEIIEYHSIVD